MDQQGILVVVSGFSGAGKGTLMKELLRRYDNYALSISATTRKPREGEENGREYFFLSEEEIEIQGALKVKKRYPEALLLFVTPPSAEELKRRLVGRGTESIEVINARLKRAAEEADGMEAYDYLLINDEIDTCVEKMHQLIQLQHEKTSYHLDFLGKMREDLYHLDERN